MAAPLVDFTKLCRSASPAELSAMLMIASLAWREVDETVSLRDEAPSRLGRFEGVPPWVEWLDDGRKVRLLKPISFTHDDWDPWPVPAGVTADGASIRR